MKKGNFWALAPIFVFLVLYIARRPSPAHIEAQRDSPLWLQDIFDFGDIAFWQVLHTVAQLRRPQAAF